MAIEELRIDGYRSLRRLRIPLQPITVVTGPNGSGKSNLYRALVLIAQSAQGRFARALAEEGGLSSAMWAGQRFTREKTRVVLGLTTDEFSFEMACGYPQGGKTLHDPGRFALDPEIKLEQVWGGRQRRPSALLCERRNSMIRIRGGDYEWNDYPFTVTPTESVLSQLREPYRYPELWRLRESVLRWRFYHQFRTDSRSPLRQWQVATYSPILDDDGENLASALATIQLGELSEALARAVHQAFGANLVIASEDTLRNPASRTLTRAEIRLETPSLGRALTARELSDGTLRFLCLAAALLSDRPPELLALNEPETSLHPDLIPVLAGMIVDASRSSQVWVTTHSALLAERIAELSGCQPIRLEMVDGETRIIDGDA
ncbi:AAA family ATPase [Planctomyces sp. SH-PL14]|uniref:AAA family ATPase n=1 Tax=Planctomyces sp. SH-PL14 TaxID=1632864 RepID=UPI00078CEA98|nr:AAA family ATPase [Planctomyces sp. SH-PL14]AMV16539.1 recombination protein F [Planctomyces sp. SH-PL14]